VGLSDLREIARLHLAMKTLAFELTVTTVHRFTPEEWKEERVDLRRKVGSDGLSLLERDYYYEHHRMRATGDIVKTVYELERIRESDETHKT
jgi:hypothetical protein